jgi:hypothetical protein
MLEVWKDIEKYKGLYQVSNKGRVRSLDRVDPLGRMRKGKIMAPQPNRLGYYMIRLSKNGVRGSIAVHRLVATAFIPNPDDKKEVNHKDGIKSHNYDSNLEWVTRSENITHAYNNGLATQSNRRHNDYRSKPVAQMLNGKIIRTYLSAMDASRQSGYSQGNISNCCRGRQKSAYGYQWKYI